MRRLILVLASLAALLGLGALFVFNTTAGQNALMQRALASVMSQPQPQYEGLNVVVCGSASPLGNDPARAQACLAVVTPEHFFLFDIGARAPLRIAQARLPMGRLDGVFLTHFHSDHIAGLPDVTLTSWVQGRAEPLAVYGARGVEHVVEGFNRAYMLDRRYRTAHHGAELLPPANGGMRAVTVATDAIVWQDELMTVRTVTVAHPPIEPAVGYRIDYRGRSVVISGDTNASSSLFDASRNADLLFHDALSRHLLDPMIAAATEAQVPILPTIMQDVIDYHADSQSLVQPSIDAGVRRLVLYHLVPAPTNALAEQIFRRGLPDDVILAADLQRFELPPDSAAIVVHNP